MFRRKVYDKLLEWKATSNGKTALLIEGARRVGKTTIVEEFAKNEYLMKFNYVLKLAKQLKNLYKTGDTTISKQAPLSR